MFFRISNFAQLLARTCLILAVVVAHARFCLADDPSDSDFFESKIRPVLIQRCQSCHGEAKQWAGLRLDSAEGLQRGGESGQVINVAQPSESELLKRVLETDPALRMPPPEEGAPLTAQQVAAIQHWIETGAKWPNTLGDQATLDKDKLRQNHWAFQHMRLPAIPTSAQSPKPASPVDAFIVAKLESSGLQLSRPADKRSLIRRATYDLTGLPPTMDEVQAFLDDASPRAFEQVVDRLLDSPRYGEHWARHWLDVARYSDTKGYVYAREERFFVFSSLYRDWVIKAFNDDMPYHRFLLLQLAADGVAPEDPESHAAMGFLTLGRRFLGVTPDIIDDRIDVVCRGLMGLTVGCARCHDHKYDPIPTTDYYSLYGVFQNSVEHTLKLSNPNSPPSAEFIAGLNDRQKQFDEYFAAQKAEAESRFRSRLGDYLFAQRELDKYPEQTFNQLVPKTDLLPGIVHVWETFLEHAEETRDPIFAVWIAFSKLKDDEFAAQAPNVCAEIQDSAQEIHPRILAAFAEPPKSAREVADRYASVFAEIEKQWNELQEAAKNAGSAPPQSLPDPNDESLRQALLHPNSPCVVPNEPIANIEWYWDTETVVELWKKQGEVDRWLLRDPMQVPHLTTLVDQSIPIHSRVFRRGNPANKGAITPRQFLSVIEGPKRKPFQQGSGRKEMAEAIVRPDNPLTARVWVNRVWQHHFGQGLVTTPSDFGVRASPPSHPELLDWLALNFIEHGWSTRWLHRTLMLSDTYQQSTQGPDDETQRAQAAQSDPENRLLWRMNPKRLAFEEMRDTMIVAAEEMDWTVGGKSVDLFTPINAAAEPKFRRSIYGQIDRQFLPTVLNVFDYANPDLHTPQRNETTVPQQALFHLNHPFVAGRARALAGRVQNELPDKHADKVRRLYHRIYQRDPTEHQLRSAIAFLESKQEEESKAALVHRQAWSYGYGAVDETNNKLKSFEPLPYSSAAAWQGGPQLPDGKLGWVHIGARTIHAGNDKEHSAVRRWTAPVAGLVSVRSTAAHEHSQGDGARGLIISNRHGILKSQVLFNGQAAFDVESLRVQAGDTVDFIVELHETLSYEDLTWSPSVTLTPDDQPANTVQWDAAKDFRTSESGVLGPLEQLVQVLLISNETMFLD